MRSSPVSLIQLLAGDQVCVAHTNRARASRMADLVDSPTSTRPAVVPPNVPVPTLVDYMLCIACWHVA